MITAQFFVELLRGEGVDFYTGVPDSLLKYVCAYITDNVDAKHHIIAANEGGAVGLAAGYHRQGGVSHSIAVVDRLERPPGGTR